MTEKDYSKGIEADAEAIFEVMSRRVSQEELQKIKEAYLLASEAHRNQKRKTGEPYIIHPIAVARIVAEEMKLGANPVMAAFLHDVVEDTPYTIDDIEKRFGNDVAFLVKVVTKQKKEHYEMSKQLDNFKQMLDSMKYDIRAILVKLADRLHNMRTLESMRPDKQMKIAGETDYIYAPLANRLGLYRIKTELENLSFRYRCPREYAQMEEMLQKDRKENEEVLGTFVNQIREILSSNGVEARIETEYRMPYSIWRKMQKEQNDFQHIDFKHYVKIVFPDGLKRTEKNTCLFIYSLLTDKFKEKPGSISNYVDNPKENGYQSFHLKLLSERGKWEEVHICSERMARDSNLGCVSSRTEGNIAVWLEKFKEVLKDIAYHGLQDGFIENVVTSFYNDDIMVFTPKGKSVILPKRATALDFAFEIHSKLGLHAKVARINGKLCSVKTELRRGDCVEIDADKNVEPQVDWIEHVLTYKAKRHLKTFLSKAYCPPYERCPHCLPIPGEEVVGFKDSDGNVSIHKRNCPIAIRLASQYGDSIVSVNFREEKELLYPVCIHIKAVDRYHLLSDLTDCITNRLGLSMTSLHTVTEDFIVDCRIGFGIHSFGELEDIITHIYKIDGVEEVMTEEDRG